MSTVTRPELSERNKYYVEKHRYYELKHFCLQYPTWEKAYRALDGLAKRPSDLIIFTTAGCSNPTEKCAIAHEYYSKRMNLVNKACRETDEVIGQYIFKAVTEGCSYEVLQTRYSIPCCRETYYELYRRFFYILNKMRE